MTQNENQSLVEKLKFWNRKSLREKGVWDWLDLLIIPIVLAAGTAYIQWQSGIKQENSTTDRNRQETLATYLEKMTELLLEHELRSSEPNAEVRVVARARTLTALRELDGERKGQVVLFLAEAGLINQKCESPPNSNTQVCKPAIISLRGADLNDANVRGASMGRRRSANVNLKGVNLEGADLEGANLGRVDLAEANLYESDLERANLQDASLTNADLRGADLKRANLRGTQLQGACYNNKTNFQDNSSTISPFNPILWNMVQELTNGCSP